MALAVLPARASLQVFVKAFPQYYALAGTWRHDCEVSMIFATLPNEPHHIHKDDMVNLKSAN